MNRFTSACSPTVFRDASAGDDVNGAAFICEPVHNLVHRAILTRHGATFRATRHDRETAAEFLASTDHWFRPTACATGPDGGLWVVDMYRHVIEHPEWIPEAWQAQLDLRAGRQQGRIYRVYRETGGRQVPPNLENLSSGELVAELDHANGWRRDTAQRLLVHRSDASVVSRLEELYDSSDDPIAKTHILGTLQGLGRLTANHLIVALGDRDARLQRRALVLSESLLAESPTIRNALRGMVELTDPAVRLQLALTLGECRDEVAVDALAALMLASDPNDDAMRAAVLSAAPGRAAALLDRLIQELDTAPRSSSLTRDLIATALGCGGVEQIGPILQAVTSSAAAPETWQFDALAAVDRGLRRHDSSLAKLAATPSAELDEPLRRVAAIVDRARRVVFDRQAPMRDRRLAMGVIGCGVDRRREDIAALASLLAPQQTVAVQMAAIERLSQFSSPEIAELLLQDWGALTPQVRSAVMSAALSRPPWRETLLAALETGRISVIDIDAASRAELTSAGEAELRRRARAIFTVASAATRSEAFEKFRKVDELTGDSDRGAKQFTKTCAACHRHRSVGNDYGPKLAALTDKSTDTLLASIVDPSRAIEKKYVNYTCLTADGV
ncbi:MAG: c-type cytochrome, partial [Planctomycetota bacterium]